MPHFLRLMIIDAFVMRFRDDIIARYYDVCLRDAEPMLLMLMPIAAAQDYARFDAYLFW